MSVRFEQAKAQKFFCYYCEHKMFPHTHVSGQPTPRDAITKDHVMPRVYGGPTTKENIVAACYQCNCLRGEICAVTFKNLTSRWFKRDPFLWIRWHTIDKETLSQLKTRCMQVYEAQLRGQARYHIEIAYRHADFSQRVGRHLARV